MKKSNYTSLAFKLIVFFAVTTYAMYLDITIITNRISAALSLTFSFIFLYKCRKNVPLFIVAFFIFYCNYSIVVGEYFIGGNLGVPTEEIKTTEIYGLTIRVLLIFTSIVSLFFKSRIANIDNFRIIPRDNIIIFYGLLLVLIYIFLFGINRGDFSTYTISITPMYEYSTIMFLVAYFFSGKSSIRRYLLIGIMFLFILQDFYYGGRITSLQLMILFLMLFLLERLSVKLILLGGSIGIFLNSLIDVYRQQYSLESINLIGVATNLVNNFFVFNTPVYAYHASATHVAAELLVTINDKINSFFMFLSHIFLGASNDMGDVTHYVKEHYFYNHGGGLIPSHFYFWLGWLGVILISVIVVIILNKLGSRNNHYLKIVTVTIIFSVPRWYLYTPLSLVRPVLIVSVLFIIFNIVHHIIKGSVGEQKNIDSSSLSVKNIQ